MRYPLFVAILVFVFPSLCHAWSGEGHQLIALIAEDMLTPEAKAAAKELLDGANIADAEVVNWADEIRRERRETAPWHYVNIPHDARGFDRARDGRDGDNVIDALERQAKVLADKTQPREKSVEALKFVIHFVGNLHRPLHCADRNGDKGGNTRLVFHRSGFAWWTRTDGRRSRSMPMKRRSSATSTRRTWGRSRWGSSQSRSCSTIAACLHGR
jgi:hypothetical protein